MNWERELLKQMIGLLIDKTVAWSKIYDKYLEPNDLEHIECQAFEVLSEITDWDVLAENITAYQEGDEDITKENLIKWCMEEIEEKHGKEIK